MTALTAAALAPIVNGYTIRGGPSKVIAVPNASQVVPLQDVTVSGILLRKQVIARRPGVAKRTVSLGAIEFSVTLGVPVALSVTLSFRVTPPAKETPTSVE